MPFSKCPVCGQSFHLLVTTDLAKWYADRAPGKKVGEVVSLKCLDCWKASESAEPDAPPNGGPATRLGNSGVTEGPPSVS
jgi:hypothetical protein